MINFFLFNLILLATGIPALFILAFGVGAMALPLAPFILLNRNSGNPPKFLAFPALFLVGGFQIYFWGLWSVYCVAMTFRFTQKPEVTWDWIYWVSGFLWCTALIEWLAYKEQQGNATLDDIRRARSGNVFFKVIAVSAFFVFAFFPNLSVIPYGWFLKLTGLNTFMLMM